MAKVPFSKLKCKIDDSVKEVKLTDDIIIEVKQYLPIQEKLELISRVIMAAHEEDHNYSNPVKVKIMCDLEIIKNYTNLSFTDKQLEETAKIYDLLYCNNIINKIYEAIPEDEYRTIINGVDISIKAVYEYQNSILGIIEATKNNYDDASMDLNQFIETFQSTDLSVLKEVVNKLG